MNEEENREQLSKDLLRLFVNRYDTFGVMKEDKSYIRREGVIDLNLIERHLKGEITIGSYTIEPKTNRIKWICFDIDPGHHENPEGTARKVLKVLHECSGTGAVLLEASRHPDPSFHIWLFFDPPIHAKTGRAFGNQVKEIVGEPELEVFPKQDEIDEDGFGNLVKLPLGLHQEQKKWSKILDKTVFTPIEPELSHVIPTSIKSEERREPVEKTKGKSPKIRDKVKNLRPCFKKFVKKGGRLSTKDGDTEHYLRLGLIEEAVVHGFGEDQIIELFRKAEDFDEKKTQRYVRHKLDDIRKSGAKTWRCVTIQKHGGCLGAACHLFKKNLENDVEPLEYESHEGLYVEVLNYVKTYIDLFKERQYDVLTAKIFESWIVDQLNTLGYVFFIGPHGSGKTRAEETMEKVCKNSLFAATMTQATLYRALEEFKPTMFFDEVQQYLKDDRQGFLAILNAGQRRGQKAFIMVKGGDGWVMKAFEVFGPKFLASTQTTVATLASRCIVINMYKAPRRMPLFFDEERAAELKGKLKKWAEDFKEKGLPDVQALFKDFRDNRTVEAFINLVMVAPLTYRQRIIDYAKEVEGQVLQDDRLSFYAELYQAVKKGKEAVELLKNSPPVEGARKVTEESSPEDLVMIHFIKEAWDADHPDNEIASQQLGKALSIMGITQKWRDSRTGHRGRIISDEVLTRLATRYDSEHEPPPEDPPEEVEGQEILVGGADN